MLVGFQDLGILSYHCFKRIPGQGAESRIYPLDGSFGVGNDNSIGSRLKRQGLQFQLSFIHFALLLNLEIVQSKTYICSNFSEEILLFFWVHNKSRDRNRQQPIDFISIFQADRKTAPFTILLGKGTIFTLIEGIFKTNQVFAFEGLSST